MKEASLLTLFLIGLLSIAVTAVEGRDCLIALIFKNMRALYKKNAQPFCVPFLVSNLFNHPMRNIFSLKRTLNGSLLVRVCS